MQTPHASASEKIPLDKYGYNTIARHISTAVITCLPLFLAAGTWSWDWAWIYSIASLIGWIGLSLVLAVENPGLLNARGRPTKTMTQNSKRWDLIILLVYTILLFVVPIVAGLDFRYGWSAETSPIIHWVGIVILLAGFAMLTWAMAANKFFDATVRIQDSQQVTATGPYRFMRHPGYVGVILQFVAVPLALGTWTAFIPALIGVALFILRTAMEDKTLRQELPGYADFAKHTRYRLLPGIW